MKYIHMVDHRGPPGIFSQWTFLTYIIHLAELRPFMQDFISTFPMAGYDVP